MSSPSPIDTDQPSSTVTALLQARRDKLAKLQELGVDPWGSRFDNSQAVRTTEEVPDGCLDWEQPVIRPNKTTSAQTEPRIRKEFIIFFRFAWVFYSKGTSTSP